MALSPFSALVTQAQVENEPVEKFTDAYFYGISQLFSYDSKPKLVEFADDRSYMKLYDEDLNLLKEFIVTSGTLESLSICDFTSNNTDSYLNCLTQTLFNNDEKYEYVTRTDNTINIVSEDGNLLQTVSIPDAYSFYGLYLWVLGDMNYLVIQSYGKTLVYKITKNPSDPSAVSVATTPIKLNVSPRLASRGEPIEVESQSGSMRQVVVTDAAGKVVYDARPAEGQRTVRIDSHRLGHGLNVVNVKHADGSGESCKILVK